MEIAVAEELIGRRVDGKNFSGLVCRTLSDGAREDPGVAVEKGFLLEGF